MQKIFILGLLLIGILACRTEEVSYVYSSPKLKIEALDEQTFLHISDFVASDGSVYPCNGMVFVDSSEAIIFDTPTESSAALELINWLQSEKQLSIKAVVINHFHVDCLGGLGPFHERDIPSWSNVYTRLAAEKEGSEVPRNTFSGKMELQVGSQKVINQFLGEAHTSDNIISVIPEAGLLFGGCMLKSVGASKGNLADANTKEWPKTIAKIKETYPDLKLTVPGHGRPGGIELLDYTIELFSAAQ